LSEDALEKIVPEHIKVNALRYKNELVFSFPDVKDIVNLASNAGIAVLGVETFQILENRLLVRDCSGYEITFAGHWNEFVKANNALAVEYIEQHRRGEDHGYILTSTSEEEFRELC
jgi:hypothetical protein